MMFVGKCVVAYLPSIREKEYYIACACEEIYAPPSAYVHLFRFTVQGTFVRGMLILSFFALHLFNQSLTLLLMTLRTPILKDLYTCGNLSEFVYILT